jgi:hypothetical protein
MFVADHLVRMPDFPLQFSPVIDTPVPSKSA